MLKFYNEVKGVFENQWNSFGLRITTRLYKEELQRNFLIKVCSLMSFFELKYLILTTSDKTQALTHQMLMITSLWNNIIYKKTQFKIISTLNEVEFPSFHSNL